MYSSWQAFRESLSGASHNPCKSIWNIVFVGRVSPRFHIFSNSESGHNPWILEQFGDLEEHLPLAGLCKAGHWIYAAADQHLNGTKCYLIFLKNAQLEFNSNLSSRRLPPIQKALGWVIHYWCCGLNFYNYQRESLSINHISEQTPDNRNLKSMHRTSDRYRCKKSLGKYHGLTLAQRMREKLQISNQLPENIKFKIMMQLFEWIASNWRLSDTHAVFSARVRLVISMSITTSSQHRYKIFQRSCCIKGVTV